MAISLRWCIKPRCAAVGSLRISQQHDLAVAMRAPLPTVAAKRAPLQLVVLGFASHGGPPSEKSWSQIVSDAVELGKSVVQKVADGVKSAAGAVVRRPGQRRPTSYQTREPLHNELPTLFPGGLLGRALGGVFSLLLRDMEQQMRSTGRSRDEALTAATAKIRNSQAVLDRLGPVSVGGPTSQSVVGQSINGVATRVVTMDLPVSGARGSALARVVHESGSSGASTLKVTVLLPSGERLRLDDGPSGGSGGKRSGSARIIDVDYKEIK